MLYYSGTKALTASPVLLVLLSPRHGCTYMTSSHVQKHTDYQRIVTML